MKFVRILVYFVLGLMILGYAFPNAQTPVTITIDGDMSDWLNISSLVNDSGTDVPGMNLISAQVTNDTNFLYIRMTYANAYEFPLLWGNVTLRNQAEDVFILMAFVSTDGSQTDTWVFPGISLNTSLNSQTAAFDDFTQYTGYAKTAPDNASIEFKVPFSDIDSGNSSNIKELDFVFWHFDVFQANIHLNQMNVEDRAPDTGFVTYFSNTTVQSTQSTSGSSSSNSTSIITTTSSKSSTSSTSLTSSTTTVINATSTPQSSQPRDSDQSLLELNMFVLSTSLIFTFVIHKKIRKL